MVRNKGLTDHIQETQRKREKALFIGEVTKVWGKEDNKTETANIEINVADVSGEHELRRVPFVCDDHAGHVRVPQVGESVVIDYVKGKGRVPVAVGLTADDRDGYRSPNAKEGHWRHEWTSRPDTSGENLYLEAEPSDHSGGAPELVRLAIKPDGLSDPTTEVTVDNSGDEPKIALKTEGDINLNADGDIIIQSGTVKAGDPPKPVVNTDGQINDTFLGLGGNVSNPGSTN